MASIERPYTSAAGIKSWRVVWRYQGKAQRGPRLTDHRQARTMMLAIEALNDQIAASDPSIRDLSIVTGKRPTIETESLPVHLGFWVDRHESRTRASNETKASVRNLCKRLEPWRDVDVRTWDDDRSQDVVDELLTKYAPLTVSVTVVVLLSALRRATEKGVRTGELTRPTIAGEDDERGQALTAEQSRALLAAIDSDRVRDIAAVSLASGLRQGEILALRVSDLNATRQGIHVRHTRKTHSGAQQIGRAKTRASRRFVTVGASTWTILQRRAQGLPTESYIFAVDDPTVAPAAAAIHTHFTRAVRSLRGTIPQSVRFHDLRHTHGSLLLDEGWPATTVAKRMGHSVAQLSRTYAHVSTAAEREVAATVDDMLTASAPRALRVVS